MIFQPNAVVEPSEVEKGSGNMSGFALNVEKKKKNIAFPVEICGQMERRLLILFT